MGIGDGAFDVDGACGLNDEGALVDVGRHRIVLLVVEAAGLGGQDVAVFGNDDFDFGQALAGAGEAYTDFVAREHLGVFCHAVWSFKDVDGGGHE